MLRDKEVHDWSMNLQITQIVPFSRTGAGSLFLASPVWVLLRQHRAWGAAVSSCPKSYKIHFKPLDYCSDDAQHCNMEIIKLEANQQD